MLCGESRRRRLTLISAMSIDTTSPLDLQQRTPVRIPTGLARVGVISSIAEADGDRPSGPRRDGPCVDKTQVISGSMLTMHLKKVPTCDFQQRTEVGKNA